MRAFATLEGERFGAILADPPWKFQTWSGKGEGRSASQHYDVMTVAQIARLPVASLAAEDCVLFLWGTWPMLPQVLQVMQAWGFTYKTCAFDWMKLSGSNIPSIGNGYWTRSNTEFCLLGTRGKPKRKHADVPMALLERRQEHSRKPWIVHHRIEALVDGPYLELFARQRRAGWEQWGNETGKFDEAAE